MVIGCVCWINISFYLSILLLTETELFPVFGHHENCFNKYLCKSILLHTTMHFCKGQIDVE